MFQLIVTVISIALVAALAIASIFYGGAAFSGSSAKTAATTLINGGQQIAGAVALFRTDNGGVNPADVQALIDGEYLQQAPTPPNGVTGSWTVDGDAASIVLGAGAEADFTLCERVEVDNGPTTSDVSGADLATVVGSMVTNGVAFDCAVVGDGTADNVVFIYRH